MDIGVYGARGVPSTYGGFETFLVVRQLVGTTLGVLRHLVWTMVAPVERDHLVGVFRGRCRGR